MLSYWLLYIFTAFPALVGNKRTLNREYHSTSLDPIWWITIIVLTIFIGFRFEVGGDWEGYLMVYDRAQLQEFSLTQDPGY